jgi:putative transcriptional regulator
MKAEVFGELLESAREALEHTRGKISLRTTELPPAPQPMRGEEVRRLRDELKASQAVFAHYLNVSTKLVQAWEAKRRRPEGAALALLRLCERHPALLMTPGATPVRTKRRPRPATRRRQHAA